MCLCILVHQWLDSTPLSMAANREEHYNRPSLPPTWRPDCIFAGSDQRQGGTWQGINDHPLLVALTNRKSTLQDAYRRSRGLLCHDVLQQATARTSVDWLLHYFPREPYNPCNLLCADATEAFAVHYDGHWASMQSLNSGRHLLADTDVNDPMHPRIQHALQLLHDLPEDWPTLRDMLESVMADHNEELIPPRPHLHPRRTRRHAILLCDRAKRPQPVRGAIPLRRQISLLDTLHRSFGAI